MNTIDFFNTYEKEEGWSRYPPLISHQRVSLILTHIGLSLYASAHKMAKVYHFQCKPSQALSVSFFTFLCYNSFSNTYSGRNTITMLRLRLKTLHRQFTIIVGRLMVKTVMLKNWIWRKDKSNKHSERKFKTYSFLLLRATYKVVRNVFIVCIYLQIEPQTKTFFCTPYSLNI